MLIKMKSLFASPRMVLLPGRVYNMASHAALAKVLVAPDDEGVAAAVAVSPSKDQKVFDVPMTPDPGEKEEN